MKTAFHLFLLLTLLRVATAADELPASTADTAFIDTITIVRDVLYPRDFRAKKSFFPGHVGLALSGGGARGIAQIGVLKAFDEAGIDLYCIAGTSMGSIIGGLYASGYNAVEIERLVQQVNFPSLFSNSPKRQSLLITQREEQDRYLFSIRFDGFKPYIPRALTAGQRLTAYLTDLTIRADYSCDGDFDCFPIRYRAVATDIGAGDKVVLAGGSLADAMRASMAFPLAFTPIELDGKSLMDGGMVDPLPVGVCRRMDADYVIAVNTSSRLLPVNKIDNPIDIANQVTTIMTQAALDKQMSEADYIVSPLMKHQETFDFNMHDSLVAEGYRAGWKAVPAIRKDLAALAERGDIHVKAVSAVGDSPQLIALQKNFPIKPGQTCDKRTIREALAFADRDMKYHQLAALVEQEEDGAIIHLYGRRNRTADDVAYQFYGNTVFTDDQLLRYFPSGQMPLSLMAVKAAADSVVTLLRNRGFDLAHLRTISYHHQSGEVIVDFDEGILDYVDIRGNNRTRSWIIKANYPLRPGEPFDARKSEKGLSDIYASGFFEHVGLDLRPTDGGIHLTINVKEKKFTQLRFGAHWDDEYQAEMFTELLDDNILGAGIQALGHAQLSSRRKQYYFSVKANRLSRTMISAQTRFYFSRLHRRLFQPDGGPMGFRQEDRLGWSVIIGQQIARLSVIDFEYRLEDISTRLSMNNLKKEHVLSAFALKSTVETYNKYPYPDYGHRQDLCAEFTGKWLGGTFDEFTKIYGSIDGYAPIGNYFNFRPKFSAGISTANLPETEKFFIGGMYSFYGYRTDQLSGDKFFVADMQLRVKFPYRIYLLGNFDYGNVFGDYESIRIRDFRKGWGASISIDTPLGPFDFGAGKADDTAWRLYLNLGLRF